MKKNLSDEQKKVLFHLVEPGKKYVKILAIAGSGKTSLLKAITDITKPKNALYLAYNKAIADESAEKFNKQFVSCVTTHSLAYHHIVKRIGYKVVSEISGRSLCNTTIIYPDDIQKNKEYVDHLNSYLLHLEYARKDLITAVLSKFFLSKFVKLSDFIDEEFNGMLNEEEKVIANAYITMMKDNKVPITHSFYLKMFHIFLHLGKITLNQYDLVMLDEAGDINEVTLEIFNLIKCDKKIMVGDDQQNIYSFNATINGFKATKNIGTTFDLSKSFRVSETIAAHIESFCKKYLNTKMTFKGTHYEQDEIPDELNRSIAFIYRTNAGLVNKMIELEKNNQSYNLSKTVESLFRIHRALIFVKPGGVIHDPDLQYIQHDCDEWNNNLDIQRIYPKFYGYLKQKNENNNQLQTALQTILKYGSQTIISIYKQAKMHEESSGSHRITLTTAHSSKGCEFDVVHLGSDLNDMLDEIIKKNLKDKHVTEHPSVILKNSDLEEFRLYYVAATRAKFKLYNATHLSDEFVIKDKNMIN